MPTSRFPGTAVAPDDASYLTLGTNASLINERVVTAGARVTLTDGGAGSTLTIASTANITSTGAVGSEPGSPEAGDLYLPTNGFSLTRYSGSAWVPWGPTFPLTAPNDAAFTWLNQGSSTVSTTNGGIFLFTPANSGAQLRGRYKSIANTSTGDLQIAFLPASSSAGDVQFMGLFLRESGTGKIAAMFVFARNTDGLGLKVSDGSGVTTYQANSRASTRPWPNMPVFLRCTISGSNYVYKWSADGQNWLTLVTVAKTTQFTTAADQWGFFVDDQTTATDLGMTVLSFLET